MVQPTHLKNMIVKLGSWNPNFRDENSKNIWVATTQDWVWPPPSQDYNMFMAKSLLPTCTDSTVNYNPRYTQLKHWCRGWLYWLGCDIRGPIYIYICICIYIYIIIYMYIYIYYCHTWHWWSWIIFSWNLIVYEGLEVQVWFHPLNTLRVPSGNMAMTITHM